MNQIDLNGRNAVVTGAARGMGYAVAQRLLQSGASVSLWDISEKSVNNAAAKLTGCGTLDTQMVDVSDYDQVANAAASVADSFGGIDLLVNCAGVAGVNAHVVDFPLDIWRQVQRVNLDGTFHTCRAIVPYMKREGFGRIVNIASMAGKDGNPNASAYSVSKAGVITLTKSLGKELAQDGILANVIVPAVIKTEMLAEVSQQQIDYMVAKIPMGRMGTVEEIAAMTAWMCSEECSYSTGAVFDMSGGRATY